MARPGGWLPVRGLLRIVKADGTRMTEAEVEALAKQLHAVILGYTSGGKYVKLGVK